MLLLEILWSKLQEWTFKIKKKKEQVRNFGQGDRSKWKNWYDRGTSKRMWGEMRYCEKIVRESVLRKISQRMCQENEYEVALEIIISQQGLSLNQGGHQLKI